MREAFLGAMGKSTSQMADMPVIALTTALEEDLPEKEGVLRVPWPCETKVLVQRIEATLARESPAVPWPSETRVLLQRIEAALLASAASTSTIPQAKSERA